mmetsp:Transcript_57408/g.118778  ORF Transcript_57408/g.118778 Transcript_57408/m.118778 type:complete len:108 (-) Transcript_57408:265-588(-)
MHQLHAALGPSRDWKPLPGTGRPGVPQGVPGVPQGVPHGVAHLTALAWTGVGVRDTAQSRGLTSEAADGGITVKPMAGTAEMGLSTGTCVGVDLPGGTEAERDTNGA